MRTFVGLCFALLTICTCEAQGAPIITLGVTLPVINQPASIQALVTDPALAGVPTGTVVIDFGDGSEPASVTLSESRVEVTHTYTSAGQFTITASYGGDTNFAPATKSLTTVSVVAEPAYQLRLFGDSLTGGTPTNWPTMLDSTLGWTSKSYACGGCKTNDQASYIYAARVDGTFASTWLLGQNDAPSTSAMFGQFQSAALAQLAWLAIPEGSEKLRAQSSAVQQMGAWTDSDVYTTTGLRSTTAGDSLTTTLPGSAIYVGLTSLLTSDYTVDVLIDGVDKGSVSPVEQYAGEYDNSEPYGLRYAVGGDPTTQHTVQLVCTNPGTSGCYVDWVGSNGAAIQPNLPPYVFAGVTYESLNSAGSPYVAPRVNAVRTVESQLASDGLAIRLADIEAVFSGSELPDCSGDGTHPGECGNEVEETVWLSSMDFLATEAQRIDLGAMTPAMVGTPLELNEAVSTSGLPVSYSIVSGSGTLDSGSLTATQPGTITIEASQAGNATVLPAEPVQFSVTALQPTITTLNVAPTTAVMGANVTLTAYVSAGGVAATSGTVIFYDGEDVVGSGVLGSDGTVQMTAAALPVGTDALTASYSGANGYGASVSAAVTVTILAAVPDFSVAVNPVEQTVQHGQSASASVTVTPQNGFNLTVTLSCSGLPAGAACVFGSPQMQKDGTQVFPLTIHTGDVAAAARPENRGAPLLWAAIPLLLLLPRRLWKRGMTMLGALLLAAIASYGITGCAGSSHATTATVTILAQAQGGLAHTAQLTLTVR